MVVPWGQQELYIRLAEWVWNPSRLDLDGEKPPVEEPISDPDEETVDKVERPARHEARQAFWTGLLAHANEQSDLHGRVSASRYHWLGTRRHGQWWNYSVLQAETRVELYIDGPVAADNKAIFDSLHAERVTVEAAFGNQLAWQRLDDKRACRISFSVPGGWVDELTWPAAIELAVDAMQRLYDALGPRVEATRGAST